MRRSWAAGGADRRNESLQDRIHRLYAWWLIDPAKFANKIKRETGALLALQNPDGGWHEVDTGPGASAVYTTGQLTWTLLRIGLPREHPAIARALRYLLSQQQDFGGWIQTTTHENFRTPMRETRYAVMAIAEAFPRPVAPRHGWGNRNDRPAHLPRTDSILHTFDDLENLWEVPRPEISGYAAAIEALLEHPEPMVRAAAAACLGRLGEPRSISPLIARLDDPSKIVWRSAAWALRRLGNRGFGHNAIAAALRSDDPATRRGAARIFAYQFHGMDDRPELSRPFFELTRDPDLLTRLQALRTLRQWFYRTADAAMSRRIVETYLARMAVPDTPVVRKSLSEGLYIMMDENLGGGVSLQKNIAELPESMRSGILEARKAFERDVLLTPVLAALREGNGPLRAGVVKAFDGSFFKGRSYARQPEGMIDVGNDREFGFLSKPSTAELEATFVPLLEVDLPAEPRRQAIQLASFLRLPAETRNASIQMALLKRLSDPDEGVRKAAGAIVAAELDLTGADDDPARREAVLAALRGQVGGRDAILRAIGRSERLARRPEVSRAIHGLVLRPDAAPGLLPLLRSAEIRDAEVLSIAFAPGRIGRRPSVWRRSRPCWRARLAGMREPREAVMELLRRGATDPSPEVRGRTLQDIRTNGNLWAGNGAGGADAVIAGGRHTRHPAAWHPARCEPPQLLVGDRGSRVLQETADRPRRRRSGRGSRCPGARQADRVGRSHGAAGQEPGIRHRAGERVRSLLERQGLDPAAVVPDARIGRPRVLSLSTFRNKVNPIFYQAAEDGHSCADCHGNHTILRIAPADAVGPGEDALMINYQSALKVVNLSEPESSLILRKPRSPRGQGDEDPSSPTGLTHVGGPRWDGPDHPAYRAIMDWVREASRAADLSDTRGPLTRPVAPGAKP